MTTRTTTITLISAAAVAAILSIGAGTAAFADPAPAAPAPAAPAAPRGCKNADVRIAALQKREAAIETRIDAMKTRDAKAVAAHHPKVAKRIEARIDKAQKNHDRLADRVAKIMARCGLTAPVSTPTPSAS